MRCVACLVLNNTTDEPRQRQKGNDMTTDTQFKYRGTPNRNKATDRQCYDCGYYLPTSVAMMLHVDFHRGERVVRETSCICGETYDVRMGYCVHCNRVYSAGWSI